MTDFEDRLTAALRTAGQHAPHEAGLAGAARRRAAARRRRTALSSVAAVVLVMGGVVGGTALLGNRGTGGLTPASGGSSSPSDLGGVLPLPHRTETWRDLQVFVPVTWGYGGMSDWCASGGQLGDPRVQRSGQVVLDILCDPVVGYGVQFFEGSTADLGHRPGEVWQYESGGTSQYPDGAWLGYQTGSGHNVVLVVTPQRLLTEEVLGSFERVTDGDANGCAPHADGQVPDVAEGRVRLCRYGVDGWLEQSETLSGDDAAAAVTALMGAPAKGDRMCTMVLTGPWVQVTSADAEGRVTLDACQGLTWDGAEHDLTADVLYWVLSPGWSGGVEGNVPMPDELRH
jgi:hypothetical protein